MIYTVTLNPSLDLTLWINGLDPLEAVFAKRERMDPAGKAVNVSRVLTSFRVPNRLVGLSGSGNAKRLESLLSAQGVEYQFLETAGFIRENLSLVLADGTLYKVDRAGFSVTETLLSRLVEVLREAVAGEPAPIMVFSGSLPPGMEKEAYRRLILLFRERGARIVLDNDFFTWEEICSLSPFLIKPNKGELCRLAGRDFSSAGEILEWAGGLTREVSHVLVSLGASGLLYAGGNQRLHAAVPRVEVKSSIGAGDSTVAGFLTALKQGISTEGVAAGMPSIEECVRFAAACGTAAVMTEGTGLLSPEDAWLLYPQIVVTDTCR